MEGLTKFLRNKDETQDSSSFFFVKPDGYAYQAGQFMFFTINHPDPDDRGARRHFTIASSPTENEIFFTTKFADPGSSYKKALRSLEPGTEIPIRGPNGEFTLPTSPEPVVFLGGGIGITPFRSMVKFATDQKLSTPITLIYANKTPADIVYRREFEEMISKNSLFKCVYTVDTPEENWSGEVGRLDADMIKRHVPDITLPIYYICGPEGMVNAYAKILSELGINDNQVRLENFSGYE